MHFNIDEKERKKEKRERKQVCETDREKEREALCESEAHVTTAALATHTRRGGDVRRRNEESKLKEVKEKKRSGRRGEERR